MEQPGRRTKIVATLGPASSGPETIRKLIDAGVDVFRLNFSHGSHEEHGARIRDIRRATSEARRAVAILQDLQGPKMRVGELAGHRPVTLSAGDSLRITTDAVAGTAERISTTYAALPGDVRKGDVILLDDGRLQLRVTAVAGREVLTEVLVGGALEEHKGMNLPHTPLSASCLTEKDLEDLRFGIGAGVDYVGLSFVRRASDIEDLRRAARSAGRDVPVIAKIERIEAIQNLEEIVAAADGVMVARGDLGVETSAAEIPILQKQILSAAGRRGKPDITATQMLETMVSNPQPSRAEATDIANAVFDGTGALMLSAETAVGKYPVEAVRTMSEIARAAERHLFEYRRPSPREKTAGPRGIAEASAHAACVAAQELGAAAIAVFTLSGRTALLVSARRPSAPVLAFAPSEETCRRLALAWGVRPMLSEMAASPEALVAIAERAVRGCGSVRSGDLVILLVGSTTVPGATNMIKVHRVDGAGAG
jgi:pyruvate kinase